MLVVDEEKCNACRECESSCSLRRTGRSDPPSARLRIVSLSQGDRHLPVVCRQCHEPACVDACPAGAMGRNSQTGAVTIDESRCVGCRMCMMACPCGGLTYSVGDKKVVKCDLCGGEPHCVANCSRGALTYGDPAREALAKRQRIARQVRSALKVV
ncbi:MAG: 4Fe-4S dicluster domain-containing protein [Firmicutes bacterium]|nr:4Fe-4S dicluster domain-containing protein [Bacillota bacterium]